MGMSGVVPLVEAAAFTFGCSVLRTHRLDPKKLEVVLALIAAVLVAALLITLTSADIASDLNYADANAWLVQPL